MNNRSLEPALGNTQYPDAYAALADDNNPSSPMGKWSNFYSKFKSTDYFTSHAYQPYVQASNLYGTSPPDAISNWNDDMNQADADLHKWADQADKWLDSEITTSELNASTQTFQTDLTAAMHDITQIK